MIRKGLRVGLGRCLLGGLLLVAAPLAVATPMERLVTVLGNAQVPAPALIKELQHSAQGLFMLGWLHEGGRYGLARDPARARDYFLRAARAGHGPVLSHCWQRCLPDDAEVHALLEEAVAQGDPEALYLQSRLLARKGEPRAADALLQQAARQRHPRALGALYLDHFVTWAAQGRAFDEAEAKLRRCTGEGLTVCYYLLGALYERHRHTRQALEAYQTLALADTELFAAYLSPAHLEGLLVRLPAGSEALVRARAANALIYHPLTGIDRIDRFGLCAEQPGYACARRLARRDRFCMPPGGGLEEFAGFRQSAGYRACVAKKPATE